MRKLTKGFYVGAFLAGSLGYWIIWAIITALSTVYPEKQHIFRMFMMPASWLTILSAVATFILIYKMWAAIQGMGASTSAGKALGFMFIPLFNLYWHFQVYWGWTKDYNKIADRDDVELPRMPEDIALAICVLPLVSLCLMVAGIITGGLESFTTGSVNNVGFQASMLISLVNIILMAVLFSRICDGVNALVDAGIEPQKPEYIVPSEDARTSGTAITSLVLGILGFFTCGLAGIVGLILGIVGLSSIKKSQGRLKGQGLAIAGIGTSGTALLIMPIMIGILMPALAKVRSQAMSTKSIARMNQLCSVMRLYCNENDGRFPPCDNWPDVLLPYVGGDRDVFTSPYDRDAGRAYAMNAALTGRKVSDIQDPARTVLLFESRFGSPPSGGPDLLPDEPRWYRGYVIGFVDFHVSIIPPERMDELIWSP